MRTKSFFLLATLVASLSLGATPACSPQGEDAASSESANTLNDLAKGIRLARLAESIEPVFKSVKNDPTEIGNIVRRTLDDAAATRVANLPADAPANAVRSTIVSLGKNKLTRQAMVRASIAAITRRSNNLKGALRGSASRAIELPNKANVFDELVLGMGPQGVAYAQATTDLAPAKRILMVDTAKKPGGTFADVNEAFSLNSTNRQNTGTRAKPGQGDLNFIQDIWGMPDFQGQKWVPAGGLADLSAVGTDISSASTLLETRVVRVRELKTLLEDGPKYPARYEVTLLDTRTNETSKVFTNKVIVSSGIGKPTIPIKDADTLKLVDDEAARVANDPDGVPGIQTFTQVVNRIGGSDTPYRWAVDKDVVVVGGGDSGKVLNEFLFRLGPQGAYGLDTAQVGNVRRVFWFGVDFDTCKRYIEQSRGRYAALSSALSNGTLVPVPVNIGAIRKDAATGKFIITGSERSGLGGASLIDTRTGQPVSFVDANGTPRFAKELGDGKASTDVVPPVDNVILATGFKSEAEEVLAPLIGNDARGSIANLLEDVAGQPEGFENSVAIATRLKNTTGGSPQSVYFIGASNEVRGGLPKPNELARVNANTVSLFANVGRTRELARLNAQDAALGLARLDAIEGFKVQNLKRARTPRLSNQGTTLARLDPKAPLPNLSAISDLELKSLMGKLLKRFDLPENVTLTITVKKTETGASVSVVDLEKASEEAITKAMQTEVPELADMLLAYFRPLGQDTSTLKTLEIVIPIGTRSAELPLGVNEGIIDVIRRNS